MSASSSFVLHCVVVCVFCLQSVQTQRLLFRPFLASVIADVNYLVLSPVAGLSLPTSNLVLLSVTPLLLACHCRPAISFCYPLLAVDVTSPFLPTLPLWGCRRQHRQLAGSYRQTARLHVTFTPTEGASCSICIQNAGKVTSDTNSNQDGSLANLLLCRNKARFSFSCAPIQVSRLASRFVAAVVVAVVVVVLWFLLFVCVCVYLLLFVVFISPIEKFP